jgi:hypothetical protein
MASVYPAIRSQSGPDFRSQQSVDPSAEFGQHSPLTHTRSQSNPGPYPALGAQNPMAGSPPPQPLAERFPCDKCDKTFSRFVFRVDHNVYFVLFLITKSSFGRTDHTTGNVIMRLNTTLCPSCIDAVTAKRNLAGQALRVSSSIAL